MKKVIIATDFWHPGINGVTKNTENISRYLQTKGFEVVIIHPSMFACFSLFFYKDVKIPILAKSKVAKILKKENPDYVYIATEGLIGLAARFYCLKNGLAFITSFQGNIPHYIEHYLKIKGKFIVNLAYAYFAWFHKKSSAVLVATKSLKEELALRNFNKLVLCPLGVDIQAFYRNETVALSIDTFKHPVFVYFGRIAEEKNIEEFLQCKLPGTKLVIGDGPLKEKLQKKYPEAVFTGWKKGQDLTDLLSCSDVFVFPSRTETFGLVIIEALACGLPVAAHDVMGPKDIITKGKDGFLDENLAQAAINCLKLNKSDCRAKALEFSLEKSSEMFVQKMLEHPVKS